MALVGSAAADSYQAPQQVLRGLIAKTDSLYLTQSERNLAKMADNPAQGVAGEGEALFHRKRGPKQVSQAGADVAAGPSLFPPVGYQRMPASNRGSDTP